MERKLFNKKTKKTTKLNWFTITRKYWKEQLFFFILTTLSCFGSFLIEQNAYKAFYDAIEKKGKASYVLKWDFKLKFLNFGETDFGNSYKWFIITMLIIIIIYCIIVIAHVYYSFWLTNKVTVAVKKKLTQKLFASRSSQDKKKTLSLLAHNVRNFAYLTIFVPNQLYYAILDSVLVFIGVSQAGGSLLFWGLGYFFLVLAAVIIFQYLFYKKELNFQKSLEKETERENFLVDHRDLIIKKNLVSNSLTSYSHSLRKSRSAENKKYWAHTLAYVVPSYSLVKATGFVFLPFVAKSPESSTAVLSLVRLSESNKKIAERLKDYPVGLSAQKRINSFLQQPERDDIQKNVLISEPIETITLKKVNFSYEENKPVLKKLDLKFQKGKINYLTGENGFGKSTIISLIMGLYQPDKGEILINNKYKLNEINLISWREKIAYAEHENLIENGLSTGQKQLADLNNLFAQDEKKEVFIFDEADNALDENNKQEFRQKIEKISKKKIVILISH